MKQKKKLNFKVRKCSIVTMLAITFLTKGILAQDYQLLNDVNVIPPSPNATSIQKFVDMPVSYYTGTPDVSVPIFELGTPQLKLPITLKYHASGLKVEEFASWVGAGWTLDAGGAISRTVRGLPDEMDDSNGRRGYFRSSIIQANGSINWGRLDDCSVTNVLKSNGEPVNIPDSVAMGIVDTEPDQYFISAPGISQKFMIKRDGSIMKLQYSDVTFLSHPFSSPQADPLPSTLFWEIKGDDGVIYKFREVEQTRAISTCGPDLSPYNPTIDYYTSSWYLDEMSLNGDWIKFEYENEYLNYPQRITESNKFKISGNGAQSTPSNCKNNTDVSGKRLARIYSSNGYEVLLIENGNNRADLSGSKKLDRIEIRRQGRFVKAFNLSQTYFGTNRKLKLDAVVQTDELGTGYVNDGYVFSYFPGAIPTMDSNNQDYWGYHNGASNSFSMIPEYKDANYHVNSFSSVNRNPSEPACKIGTLNKITYPTGGYTEFGFELHKSYNENRTVDYEYEAKALTGQIITTNFVVTNQCSASLATDLLTNGPMAFTRLKKWNGSAYVDVTLQNVSLGNRKILPAGSYQLYARNEDQGEKFIRIEYEQQTAGEEPIGGLRLNELTFFDPVKNSSIKRTFTYTNPETSVSSGVLFRKPYFGGYKTTFIDGLVMCVDNGSSDYINLSANNQAPLVVYNGSHIGYTMVTEYYHDFFEGGESGGKTFYKFKTVIDPAIKTYPFVPDADYSHINGQMERKEVFGYENSQYIPLERTDYTYAEEINTNTITGLNFKYRTTSVCYHCGSDLFVSNVYQIKPKWYYLTVEQTTSYKGGVELSSAKNYYYQNTPRTHHKYIRTVTQSSENIALEEQIGRHTNPTLMSSIARFRGAQKISGEGTDYNGKLPLYHDKWNSETGAYERIRELSYDVNNNLIEDKKTSPGLTGKYSSAYLWGYANSLLVAEVKNAKVQDVFYADFEELTTNFSTGKTGEKSSLVGLSKFLSGLTNGVYVLSYWTYTNGSWVFHPTTVTVSSGGLLITLSGQIDDVRFHPVDAQMTTYTYDPARGITSITDAGNVTTYYTYDDFGRLKTIEDSQHAVTKSFDYKFKQ